MRITIAQETAYRYAVPAKSVIQTLRVTPRSHDGQYVVRWRIDVDRDIRLSEAEDAFGNITHAFDVPGPVDTLTVRVEGEVETHDRAGVLRDTIERFPPSLYLRPTALTTPDAAIASAIAEIGPPAMPELDFCHGLMGWLHRTIAPADEKGPLAGAGSALAARAGRVADRAHLFITCARARRIPARFASGHVCVNTEGLSQAAGHGWAEAYISGLGWVGFDPALDICPTDAHVRVAVALDQIGAAPVRGARQGGEGEFLDIHAEIRESSGGWAGTQQQQG